MGLWKYMYKLDLFKNPLDHEKYLHMSCLPTLLQFLFEISIPSLVSNIRHLGYSYIIKDIILSSKTNKILM
jgi:hypothetical protein